MATIQNTTPAILLEKPVHEVPSRSRPNSAVIRSVISDEGLPEVVHPNQDLSQNVYYDAPIPVDSETDKRFNEAPIPIGTLDDPAPPLPARNSTPQYPYSPDSFAPQQPAHSQPSYSQPPHSASGYAHQGPPQYHNNGGYAQQPPSYNGNQVITYVTPLHELGDHPKFVDCPFCQHRAETRVKKTSSKFTHASATALGFTTIVGAAVPYAGNWACHTTHYCTNCEHKVAMRKWGSREMKPFGTPDHMREVSRYPSASSQTMSNGSRMS